MGGFSSPPAVFSSGGLSMPCKIAIPRPIVLEWCPYARVRPAVNLAISVFDTDGKSHAAACPRYLKKNLHQAPVSSWALDLRPGSPDQE